MFEKLTLVGIGLIGSSIARAARLKGLARHIAITTRKTETLEEARALGLGDSYSLDAAESVRGADLVILCTPVGAYGAVMESIKDALAPGAQLRSGVLCLMGTSGHRHADTPPGPNFSGNQNDAEALVARGYVAISPPYPTLGFGGRSGIGIKHDPDLKALGYASGTMKAIWDNIRALDVLETLPFVKRSGFATLGTSLGGHNSIYTAVFDERIRVIVSSCGFDSYLEYAATPWEPGKGWAQNRYMPRITDFPRDQIPFDFHEMIGALAPRAFFANSPSRDANFKWRSAARIVAAALPVYRLHGVPELIRIVHPDAGHEFPQEVREQAYAWIEQFL